MEGHDDTLTPVLGARRRPPPARAPQPHLFLALEYDRPLGRPSRHSLADLDLVTLSRGPERRALRSAGDGKRQLTIDVPDRWMSAAHARLRRDGARWTLEDTDSTNGTTVNGSPRPTSELADGDLIEVGHTLFCYREVQRDPEQPADVDAGSLTALAPGLTTLVAPFAAALAQLSLIARSTLPVILSGETGTGKEVAARAIHALSGRAGPFLAVNCGAITQTLVESELFGYRKGAFSGATEDRAGLIRAADHGTLLLDEIGDLPSAAQTALLRVLQEGEVLAVGSTRPVKIDVRIVAASPVDLAALVARGAFRADLFSRISGFTLRMPPLRERRDDLGILIADLLCRLAPEGAERIAFSPEAAHAIFRYRWPLNIRELEKCLGAALVLAGAGPIELSHLPEALRAAPSAPVAAVPQVLADEDRRRKEELVELLVEHRGNVATVARAMGKARMQIHRWIQRYGLDLRNFRP